MQDRRFHNESNNEKREHCKVNNKSNGVEELDILFGAHSIDCEGNGCECRGEACKNDNIWLKPSCQRANHVCLASSEAKEKIHVNWGLLSEAANNCV